MDPHNPGEGGDASLPWEHPLDIIEEILVSTLCEVPACTAYLMLLCLDADPEKNDANVVKLGTPISPEDFAGRLKAILVDK